MKTFLSYFISFSGILCASLCGCPTDNYQPPVNIELKVEDLVYIDDDRTNYSVGDTLWVNVDIPKFISDANTGRSYDIFETTKAESIRFSFRLSKESNFDNLLEVQLVDSEVVIEEGLVEIDKGRLISDILLIDSCYKLRFGAVLKEAGNYVLSNFDDDNLLLYVFDSNFEKQIQENLFITTNFRTSSSTYSFLVN
jgi:hypothetical protein